MDNNLDVKTIGLLILGYSLIKYLNQYFNNLLISASVFGEIFIRDPPRSRSDKSSHTRTSMSRKKTNFVYHFLVNDQSDLIIGTSI